MSLPEAILITSPVAASGPNLADWLTATGTVGLALVTVITLIATVRIASVDRRHDDEVRGQDRRDAEGRLLEERQAADQRLREERNHAEDVRRQERRVDSAIVLLERIARIMPLLGDLPYRGGLDAARKSECDDAVLTLGSGVHTHAALVGQETLAQQYRNVVSFVDAVWTAKWAEEPSVITRLAYRRDQSGYRPQGFDQALERRLGRVERAFSRRRARVRARRAG
jgi:hypothetical protein